MNQAPIACFWIEPTDHGRIMLRRYSALEPPARLASDRNCSGPLGCHNARVNLDDDIPHDSEMIDEETGRPFYGRSYTPDDAEKADPSWPTKCDHCSYEFKPDDHWQRWVKLVWERVDTGGRALMDDMPPGAMWDAQWWGKRTGAVGDDGICLTVKTPSGDWMVDGKANNSPDPRGWTRTGDPPMVTARPSIGIGRPGTGRYFHAFLTNGELVRCSNSEV